MNGLNCKQEKQDTNENKPIIKTLLQECTTVSYIHPVFTFPCGVSARGLTSSCTQSTSMNILYRFLI